MIKFEERFEKNAYRIVSEKLSPTVSEVHEGQFVTYDAKGELVLADGTKKAFIAIGSKRPGRDNTTSLIGGTIGFLHGHYRLKTDQFNALGTYTEMVALKVGADSKLTPVTGLGTEIVEAYAVGAPSNGFLEIYSA